VNANRRADRGAERGSRETHPTRSSPSPRPTDRIGALSTRPELDIAVTGSMGKASSFGLGLALARPDLGVWVLTRTVPC